MWNLLLEYQILVLSMMLLWAIPWIIMCCAAESVLLKIVTAVFSGPIGWLLLLVGIVVIYLLAKIEQYISKPFRDLDGVLYTFEARWPIFHHRSYRRRR